MTDSYTEIVGESYGVHDGAMAVIDSDGLILSANHTERYTGIKHDKSRHPAAETYTKMHNAVSVYYERPRLKNVRQILSGEPLTAKPKHDRYISHHWSHAAGAYYTRPTEWGDIEPVCIVIDAIGEFDTASIWYKKKKVWSEKYPMSLGLMYSAATQAIGLEPNRDEHLTMARSCMAAPEADLIDWFDDQHYIGAHKGYKIPEDLVPEFSYCSSVAASIQKWLEYKINDIMTIARGYSTHACYAGGVALNCVANTKARAHFHDMWIMHNPGDAGAALGAAAAYLDKPLKWYDPYLGTHARMLNEDRDMNPKDIAKNILTNGAAGVIHGGGEFGPRALGNRSLLGNPIGHKGKDIILKIKDRAWYSPLAPAILSEHFDKYFDGPENEYMSYVSKAHMDAHREAETTSSVVHINGTARVQSVKPRCGSIIRPILEEWYELTGCPMLINTSLNEKHKPMPSEAWDKSKRSNFERTHKINVWQ